MSNKNKNKFNVINADAKIFLQAQSKSRTDLMLLICRTLSINFRYIDSFY